MKRNRIFSMEEINDNLVPEVVEPVQPVIIDESQGEVDMAEAIQHLEKSNELENACADAMGTVTDLSTISSEVSNSLSEGGMSQPEARALEVAVEHMLSTLGLPRDKPLFPAMEGFADKSSRIHNTKMALESIGEKTKKIIERIMKVIQAAIEYAKNFFGSLFNAVGGMKKKAEQLAEAAKQKAGTSNKGKVVSGGFIELLVVDGKHLQDGSSLLNAYKTHIASDIIKEDRVGIIKDIAPIFEEALAKSDDSEINKEDPMGEGTFLDKALDKITVGLKESKTESGGDQYEEKLTFGNYSFFQVFENSSTKVFVGPSASAQKPEEAKEVPALELDKVSELASLVAEHLGSYASLTSDVKILGGKLNEIMAKIKALFAKDEGKVNGQILSQIQMLNTLTVGAAKALRTYDVKVAGAILDYGMKSYKSATIVADTSK